MLQSAEKIRYPNGIVPQDQLSQDQLSQPQLFTRSTPITLQKNIFYLYNLLAHLWMVQFRYNFLLMAQ